MRTFLRIWAGQSASMIGSGLTSFALGIWVYQATGSATLFTLAALVGVLPGLVVSPVAGVIADRWDRRRVMLACDVGGGALTLAAALLFLAGRIQVWQVCTIIGCTAVLGALHGPAWTAATTVLVPPEQLGRANGLLQTTRAIAQVAAPALAGGLVVAIGVYGVLLIDAVSFLLSVTSLLGVRIPAPPAAAGAGKRGSLVGEALEGWVYVGRRRGFVGLLLFGFGINFILGMAQVSFTPLVMSFSSAAVLGSVMSVGGVGMLAGSVVMGAWGGPRRRIRGILGFGLLIGVSLLLFGLRASVPLLFAASFCLFLCVPLISGSSQVVWQRKVALELQGRVFAVRSMSMMLATPLAYLLTGPLLDQVLEPAMAPGGWGAGSIGLLLGVGAGRGVGLLFVGLGGLTLLMVALAALVPGLRRLEDEVPDAIPDIAAPPPVVAAANH